MKARSNDMSEELSKLGGQGWKVEQTIFTPLAVVNSVMWTFVLTKE